MTTATTNKQLDLFSGQELRDAGMQAAVDHANCVHPKWSDAAYNFLLIYMKQFKEFMVEEVRQASEGTVPQAPNQRAWGGIVVRAVRLGLIRRKGFRNVANAKAHCTPATVWEVIP